ncbi:MAG: hypothetical protein RR738_04710 [Anaerorhabdus sp.]|uniref:hypothetical protein n=1 Tax=Anaerorhabdus sp. TaxID=1872524 RepID=UPI002FC80CDA
MIFSIDIRIIIAILTALLSLITGYLTFNNSNKNSMLREQLVNFFNPLNLLCYRYTCKQIDIFEFCHSCSKIVINNSIYAEEELLQFATIIYYNFDSFKNKYSCNPTILENSSEVRNFIYFVRFNNSYIQSKIKSNDSYIFFENTIKKKYDKYLPRVYLILTIINISFLLLSYFSALPLTILVTPSIISFIFLLTDKFLSPKVLQSMSKGNNK